jgi:hypothetical protein
MDGSTDPDPDRLHSVVVFLGDATGSVADGERYELTLAEGELVGFSSGGSVPAAEGTLDRTPTRRHRPTARPRSASASPAEQASGSLGPAATLVDRLRPGSTFVHSSLMVGSSGDPDGVRVPAGQEALATIERSRMAASSP